MKQLVCIEHFGAYAKGDIITDQDEVERVLKSPQHTHVVVRGGVTEPRPPAAPDLLGDPAE